MEEENDSSTNNWGQYLICSPDANIQLDNAAIIVERLRDECWNKGQHAIGYALNLALIHLDKVRQGIMSSATGTAN